MKPSKPFLITLSLLIFSAVGCGDNSSNKAEPIKKNDYTTEPGGAAKAKGSDAPKAN